MKVLLTLLAFGLISCSSFSSHPWSPTGGQAGIQYYLPKPQVKLVGSWNKDKTKFSIEVTTENLPDRDARYFLRPRQNAWFDDKHGLKVNGKGLLETVSYTSEDKSGAIAGAVGSLAASVYKFEAGVNAEGIAPLRAENQPVPFVVTIDPFNEVSKSVGGFTITWKTPLENGRSADAVFSEDPVSGELVRNSVNGIFFRPLVPVSVTVKSNERLAVQYDSTAAIVVPDPSAIYWVNAKRNGFSKTTRTYGFADGSLVELNRDRTSPILGVIGIPKELITAIVPLPLELKQIQNNIVEADQKADGLASPSEEN